jgi:hypothetical protein
MRRKVLFSAVLAMAAGATVMFTGQSFAASNPESGPRTVAAAPAPNRSNPAEPAPATDRTRNPSGGDRAPRQATEPEPTAKSGRRAPQDTAVTGRVPAERASAVRATPRFTG